MLKSLLLDALPGFFPLLRAMLHLVQRQVPPARKAEVLSRAGETFNTTLSVLQEIAALRTGGRFFLDRNHIVHLFTEILRITHELSTATDALAV